jgi:hypothetical protein
LLEADNQGAVYGAVLDVGAGEMKTSGAGGAYVVRVIDRYASFKLVRCDHSILL